jgi:hypothetical protein
MTRRGNLGLAGLEPANVCHGVLWSYDRAPRGAGGAQRGARPAHRVAAAGSRLDRAGSDGAATEAGTGGTTGEGREAGAGHAINQASTSQ